MKTKTLPLRTYNKYKKLRQLVDQWTRAEVMSRSPAIDFPEYGDYYATMLEKRDEIRKLMYGTSNFIEIGEKLGLPMDPTRKRKKRNA